MLLGRVKYSFKDQKSVSFQLGCDEGWVTVTNATIRARRTKRLSRTQNTDFRTTSGTPDFPSQPLDFNCRRRKLADFRR